jgi:hypothetical protein
MKTTYSFGGRRQGKSIAAQEQRDFYLKAMKPGQKMLMVDPKHPNGGCMVVKFGQPAT